MNREKVHKILQAGIRSFCQAFFFFGGGGGIGIKQFVSNKKYLCAILHAVSSHKIMILQND